jgi:hypothetical protein
VILKGLGAKTYWLAVNRQSYSNYWLLLCSQLVGELVNCCGSAVVSCCCCWGRGPFGNLEEGRRPPLEAASKQRQWKRDCGQWCVCVNCEV